MKQPTLLFHHTHTPDSNRFEREIRGLNIETHATDYVALASRLPADQDVVFVKTDHWKTEPEFFDRLETRLNNSGANLSRFASHVCFELEGSRAAIINGVEAAVDRGQNHLTICGLPLESAETYTALDLEELSDIATDVAWIAPAHIGMPFHHISSGLMSDICELDADPRIRVALGFTTGYFPSYNRISRNELPTRISVREYAKKHDLPLLPELDLHAVVPEGFSGCGVVESGVTDELEEGRLPVDELLAADLFRPSGCRNGITKRQFLQNYAAFVPFLNSHVGSRRVFVRSLPDTEWLRSINSHNRVVELQ